MDDLLKIPAGRKAVSAFRMSLIMALTALAVFYAV